MFYIDVLKQFIIVKKNTVRFENLSFYNYSAQD